MSQPRPDSPAAVSVDRSGTAAATARSLPERSDLILAFARVLHANGQSTYETVSATERLSNGFGVVFHVQETLAK